MDANLYHLSPRPRLRKVSLHVSRCVGRIRQLGSAARHGHYDRGVHGGPTSKYWPFVFFWQFCVILLSMVCSSRCHLSVIGSTCLCAHSALFSAHVPRAWGLFTVTGPIHNEALVSTHMLHDLPVYFGVYFLKLKYFHTRRVHVLGNDARLHLALLCYRRARCAWRAWRAALISRLKQFSAERCKSSLYASIYAMTLWSTASSQNLGGGIQSGVHCTGDLLRESRTVSVKCNGVHTSHRQRHRGRTNRKGGYKG